MHPRSSCADDLSPPPSLAQQIVKDDGGALAPFEEVVAQVSVSKRPPRIKNKREEKTFVGN